MLLRQVGSGPKWTTGWLECGEGGACWLGWSFRAIAAELTTQCLKLTNQPTKRNTGNDGKLVRLTATPQSCADSILVTALENKPFFKDFTNAQGVKIKRRTISPAEFSNWVAPAPKAPQPPAPPPPDPYYDYRPRTVAAPGEGIWSTGQRDKFHQMDGTSMAAPIVAGVALR